MDRGETKLSSCNISSWPTAAARSLRSDRGDVGPTKFMQKEDDMIMMIRGKVKTFNDTARQD